ncbi:MULTISPECIES: DUF4236 domain-containing protein [Massilia]|uniref:DUF4236 domain-containing protein n=1 Tax=Massilia TaxID=149698 RepID=UPI002552D28A|nr:MULTISPECIES: DUF4236 domain-containing protein [Massilia]MDK6076442.1 DUF4236 domain-containing protein [Massilia varians]
MGLRFRKSFKLAPGVRLNVSSSGMSWSLGPRGASVSIGKRGTYFNASIPGTGLSSRTRLDAPAAAPRRTAEPETIKVSLSIQVGEDGVVRYSDQNGFPVSEELIAQARRQHPDAIRQLLERRCNEINNDISALGNLHWYTPAPLLSPKFAPAPFDVVQPLPPEEVTLTFAERFLPGKRQWAEAENLRRQSEYRAALEQYEQEKGSHVERNVQARMAYSAAMAGNPDPMEKLLEHRLREIVWPRETLISLAVSEDGTALELDVDLPEIEHMPTMRATLGARSWDLTIKEAGATVTRKLYQQHVHSLGFRILGEAFAALPTVRKIVLSGYSQRPDSATGQTKEDYLYSVRVDRYQWNEINFSMLSQIDPSEALAAFDLRRNMTATGIFKPVIPLDIVT